MITASLLLNIFVLIPVCYLMITNSHRIEKTLGVFTPARGILLALYSTILFASVILLLHTDEKLAFALFFMQIVYKLLSPFTVKTLKHPFVLSNIIIAVFHLFTIYRMLDSGSLYLTFK